MKRVKNLVVYFNILSFTYKHVRIIRAVGLWAKNSSRIQVKSFIRIVSVLSVICRQIVVSPFCYVLSSCPLDALAT